MNKRYIKPLSEAEVITLEEGYRNHSKVHFRNRCKSILMSHEKYSIEDIAKFFKVRRHTIGDWFTRWETVGISGLGIAKGRGVTSVLDSNNKEHESVVLESLKDNRQNLSVVCDTIHDVLGLTVSKRMVKTFLKKKDIVGNAFEHDCPKAQTL